MLNLVEHGTFTPPRRMHQRQVKRLLSLPVPQPDGLQYRRTISREQLPKSLHSMHAHFMTIFYSRGISQR